MAYVIHRRSRAGSTIGAATAALLHDVGRLILDQAGGPDPADGIADDRDPIEGDQQTSLALHQAGIGALVLERWGVPGSIVDAVRHHPDPFAQDGLDAHVVFVAAHVADELLFTSSGRDRETVRASAALLKVDLGAIAGVVVEQFLVD